MIKDIIARLVDKINLSEKEAAASMDEIMSGKATPAQIAAFITALRMKGETVEEITGCARIMQKKATHLKINKDIIDLDRDEINVDLETVVDTCGTGGDGTNTFNISTTTAFVVSGGGCLVAKHGNRSVSSLCGSADVVQALGINLDISPEKVKECIEKIGIGFLYAPLFHSAMKYALGPRREIGIRTIFNILGPLTNPAKANVQVLGVYKPELTEVLANVLKNLGAKNAFVVYGEGSFDEITITGRTRISQLKNGEIKTYYIQPEDFGLRRRKVEEIKGGSVEENKEIILNILKGEKGAKRDIVLLNSSAVFISAERAKDFPEGIRLAEESIDSKRALKKLEDLIKFTNQ